MGGCLASKSLQHQHQKMTLERTIPPSRVTPQLQPNKAQEQQSQSQKMTSFTQLKKKLLGTKHKQVINQRQSKQQSDPWIEQNKQTSTINSGPSHFHRNSNLTPEQEASSNLAIQKNIVTNWHRKQLSKITEVPGDQASKITLMKISRPLLHKTGDIAEVQEVPSQKDYAYSKNSEIYVRVQHQNS